MMREITYHKLFRKKVGQWNRIWKKKNLRSVVYWLVSQNCVIRTMSGSSFLLWREIKHKDMIQKTDRNYRNKSTENKNTMNTMNNEHKSKKGVCSLDFKE